MTSISKCEDTFCKKYVEKSNKMAKKWVEELYQKDIPKLIEKIDKQLDTKTDLGDEKRSELKKEKKMHEKSIRHWKNKTLRKKKDKKMGRMMFAVCKERYCNPECKHTSFETGKEISESYRKTIRKLSQTLRKGKKNKSVRMFSQKNMMKDFEESFRDIHGNRENVLRDGFYEELPPKKVAYLRKRGAVSGCIKDVKMDPNFG
jgi:ribosomal protein S13